MHCVRNLPMIVQPLMDQVPQDRAGIEALKTAIASSPANQDLLVSKVKLDHSGEGLDWTISYSRSIHRTPDLNVLPVESQGLRVGLVFPSCRRTFDFISPA